MCREPCPSLGPVTDFIWDSDQPPVLPPNIRIIWVVSEVPHNRKSCAALPCGYTFRFKPDRPEDSLCEILIPGFPYEDPMVGACYYILFIPL